MVAWSGVGVPAPPPPKKKKYRKFCILYGTQYRRPAGAIMRGAVANQNTSECVNSVFMTLYVIPFYEIPSVSMTFYDLKMQAPQAAM